MQASLRITNTVILFCIDGCVSCVGVKEEEEEENEVFRFVLLPRKGVQSLNLTRLTLLDADFTTNDTS